MSCCWWSITSPSTAGRKGSCSANWVPCIAAFAAGQPSPLPELDIQYADYAAWQRQRCQSEALASELAYWQEHLAGAPPLLEVPTDRPRPPQQSYRGQTLQRRLPRELSAALKRLSESEQATLYMTLLAAFEVLLYRYTGQDDLVVGSALANRSRPELERLIGFFVNTVALRGDLSGEPTFRELLARVRQITLEAYAHQDVPFEMVVQAVCPQRSAGYSPLFQVMFVLQTASETSWELPGVHVTRWPLDPGTAKFDLTAFAFDEPDGLQIALEYNTDLFDDSTIERMAGHYQRLLEAIVAAPRSASPHCRCSRTPSGISYWWSGTTRVWNTHPINAFTNCSRSRSRGLRRPWRWCG